MNQPVTNDRISIRYGSARDRTVPDAIAMVIDFWTEADVTVAASLTPDNALEYQEHTELDIATRGVQDGDVVRVDFLGTFEEFHKCDAAQEWFETRGFSRGCD